MASPYPAGTYTPQEAPSFAWRTNAQGNLTAKGGYAQSYSDPLHPHAVTSDGKGNTYTYDANGNMISRKGKTLKYDAKNRLASIWDGETKLEEYTYDHTGYRVKKWQSDGTVTYDINGLYHVVKAPDTPDRQIKYIHGMEGDLVAQITANSSTSAATGLFKIKKDMYNWKTPRGFFLMAYATASWFFEDARHYRYMVQALFALMLLGCLGLLAYSLFFRKERMALFYRRLAHGVPVVLIVFCAAFCITGCEIPFLSDSSIEGIQYFHPNHVGSVKMLTDKDGNKVAEYFYTPYGELQTGFSNGTDLSKYKYTAQQEDASTGLYYYKARFYDPGVGRFLTADSIVPNSADPQAFNRYMYVKGNPVNHNDPSGHWPGKGFWKKITHKMASSAINTGVYLTGKAYNGLNKLQTKIAGFVGNVVDDIQTYAGKAGHYVYKTANSIFRGQKALFNNILEKANDTVFDGDWRERQWDGWLRETLFMIATIVIIVGAFYLGPIAGCFAIAGALVGGSKGHPFNVNAYKDFNWGYASIGAIIGLVCGFAMEKAIELEGANRLYGMFSAGSNFYSFLDCLHKGIIDGEDWEPLPVTIYKKIENSHIEFCTYGGDSFGPSYY